MNGCVVEPLHVARSQDCSFHRFHVAVMAVSLKVFDPRIAGEFERIFEGADLF